MKLFKIIRKDPISYGIEELIIKATSGVDAINIALDQIVDFEVDLDYLFAIEEDVEMVKNRLREDILVEEIKLDGEPSILLFTTDS